MVKFQVSKKHLAAEAHLFEFWIWGTVQQPPLKTGWARAGTPPHSSFGSGLWSAVPISLNMAGQLVQSIKITIYFILEIS